MAQVNTPLKCAQACLAKKEWCRTFTFTLNPASCNLYKGSILIDDLEDPVEKDGTDLYSFSKSLFFK